MSIIAKYPFGISFLCVYVVIMRIKHAHTLVNSFLYMHVCVWVLKHLEGMHFLVP